MEAVSTGGHSPAEFARALQLLSLRAAERNAGGRAIRTAHHPGRSPARPDIPLGGQAVSAAGGVFARASAGLPGGIRPTELFSTPTKPDGSSASQLSDSWAAGSPQPFFASGTPPRWPGRGGSGQRQHGQHSARRGGDGPADVFAEADVITDEMRHGGRYHGADGDGWAAAAFGGRGSWARGGAGCAASSVGSTPVNMLATMRRAGSSRAGSSRAGSPPGASGPWWRESEELTVQLQVTPSHAADGWRARLLTVAPAAASAGRASVSGYQAGRPPTARACWRRWLVWLAKQRQCHSVPAQPHARTSAMWRQQQTVLQSMTVHGVRYRSCPSGGADGGATSARRERQPRRQPAGEPYCAALVFKFQC